MANLNGYVLTQAGKNLFAKSSSGECKVVFTKAKIGESETTLDELLIKDDLVGTKLKLLDIVSSKAEENKFTIIITVTNSGLEEHFYIRQLGIFAKGLSIDGLNTEILPEKLIAVAYDTNPDVIPAETNNIPYTKQMNIGFSINNADKAEIIVSLTGVVTSEVLENHNNDTKAHSNLIKSIFGIEEVTEDNIKEKIEEYAKKVCLPLSGGTMEGLVSLFNGSTVPTPEEQDNSKKITNTEWVQDFIDNFLVGNVIYRPFLQEGYVKLNGATVQREDYPRLVQYATTNSLFTADNSNTPWLFGNGDGETTFVLPDYRNLFIEGGDTPSKIEAGLPNITGEIKPNRGPSGTYQFLSEGEVSVSGAFNVTTHRVANIEDYTSQYETAPASFSFNASLSNPIYGNAETVQPPSIVLIPQIKY